ncbi:MAG: hypothetical protein ACE145_06485 [Terriglobia bacterium]
MPNSYPKEEHIRYIEPRARRMAAEKQLQFVDVVAQSATEARNYLVRVRKSPHEILHTLRVPLELVERCIDASSDNELVAKLDEELAKRLA